MNDEHLESLLRQAVESEEQPREPSYHLTANVLTTVARRQRRRRQLLMTSSVAGAYLAGMLTMWFCLPAKDTAQGVPRQQQIISQTDRQPSQDPTQQQEPGLGEISTPQVDEPTQAVVVATEPPSPVKSVYQLFRDLGDASHARGDVTSSIRYYRLALESASKHELQPAGASDNLLLLSLKQDRIAATQLTTHGESL